VQVQKSRNRQQSVETIKKWVETIPVIVGVGKNSKNATENKE